jgi:peptide/nickel transport system ATP-binding protein
VTVLRIENLTVSFVQYERGLRRRVVPGLTGMDLDVASGEVVALVGASGAGKSLLAHAVLGLLPPNAVEGGRVLVDGTEIAPPARRRLAGRNVVLLPQSVTFLDPVTPVGRQIRRSARLARLPDPRAAAVEALQRHGLGPEVLRQYPHELSGGMARRVLVAMATLGRPRVILADEPTPGLQQESAETVLAELRARADAGCGVVLITHDLIAALGVSDRVVICDAGRTVDAAAPTDFRGDGEHLAHPYTRALWQALPTHGLRVPAEARTD